jgi:hypothetical protein
VGIRIAIPAGCLLLVLAGCSTSPQRPAASTAGCARAVVEQLPPGLDDREKHCVASAEIARRCSAFESWLTGWGKEARDLFGHGDPSLEDLRADRAGRRCASVAGGPGTVLECCWNGGDEALQKKGDATLLLTE